MNHFFHIDFLFSRTPPPLMVDEEESIGQRTRSKLSLSETPLEYIEQAFIPPDITTDMYDWDVDCIDPEYKQFLTEYMKPLNQDPIVDDDPEADPEYNFMEDIETDMGKSLKQKNQTNFVIELIIYSV